MTDKHKARKEQPLSRRIVRGALKLAMQGLFNTSRTLRFDKQPEIPEPAVVACWHGEIQVGVEWMRQQNVVTLASSNHMGYAIAEALKTLGYTLVSGSSSKGGQEALNELRGYLRQGRRVVLTVDGPRGPRHEMKPGVVMLAARAKLPIYMMRFEYPGITFNTWDKFRIALPFSRVKVACEKIDIDVKEHGLKPTIDMASKALRDLHP